MSEGLSEARIDEITKRLEGVTSPVKYDEESDSMVAGEIELLLSASMYKDQAVKLAHHFKDILESEFCRKDSKELLAEVKRLRKFEAIVQAKGA